MIYDDYEAYVKKYRLEYGEKTIVLLECGSFYEIYNGGTGTVSSAPLIDMRAIGDLLNIQVSRRNKAILEVSRTNYEMAGFPSYALKKFTGILVNNGYTVVVVSQVTPPPNPRREVTEIVSPGTCMDIEGTTSSLAVIYIEEMEAYKTTQPIVVVGCSVIDVTTGNNQVYEVSSANRDLMYPLDEVYRIMSRVRPREVVIFSKPLRYLKGVEEYLDLAKYSSTHNLLGQLAHDDAILKLSYQQEVIERAFPRHGLLSPIEYVGLERSIHAIPSYVKMLQFVHTHNERLLKHLPVPESTSADSTDTMILSYNSVNQLDILGESGSASLLHILDNSVTAIGRRYFKDRLLRPYRDAESIKKAHAAIEAAGSCTEEVRKYLGRVYDIERLYRRITLSKIQPMELYSFIQSLEAVGDASVLFWGGEDRAKVYRMVKDIIGSCGRVLNMDRICMYNRDNMDAGIFLPGSNDELERLNHQISLKTNVFRELVAGLNAKCGAELFKLESTDKEGYYVGSTHKRYEDMKASLQKIELAGKTYNIKDFKVRRLTNTVKITHDVMDVLNDELAGMMKRVGDIALGEYEKFIELLREKCEPYVPAIVGAVQQMDFVCTNAYNARVFRLRCPDIVVEAEKSYVNVRGLRHLIIERVQPTVPYVTNDFIVGGASAAEAPAADGVGTAAEAPADGVLLYGINSSGKSSLMKSVGLAVIMAQAGMYVPCSSMTLAPYDNIFTRIFSSDDIYRSQSTFTKEILELRNILKRAGKNSLVIGDELCSGTESISAVSIVSAGICTLAARGCSFIFATHLHDLVDIPEVRALENLKVYHLSVRYDEKEKILVYDRKLKEGSGSSLYGLEVCKSLGLDLSFMELAHRIRQGYTNVIHGMVDEKKKSRYNRRMYITPCAVCGANESHEVHHIRQQKEADADGYIDHFHKNARFNLVTLCEKCHDKVHTGELNIEGYVQTSEGIRLDSSF